MTHATPEAFRRALEVRVRRAAITRGQAEEEVRAELARELEEAERVLRLTAPDDGAETTEGRRSRR